jgi:hypothetical protein
MNIIVKESIFINDNEYFVKTKYDNNTQHDKFYLCKNKEIAKDLCGELAEIFLKQQKNEYSRYYLNSLEMDNPNDFINKNTKEEFSYTYSNGADYEVYYTIEIKEPKKIRKGIIKIE